MGTSQSSAVPAIPGTAEAPASRSTYSGSEPARLTRTQAQAQLKTLRRHTAQGGSPRIKVGVLALGAFAVIFVGVNTGALLKRDSQISEERKKSQASADELITVLESQRRALVRKREKAQERLDLFGKKE